MPLAVFDGISGSAQLDQHLPRLLADAPAVYHDPAPVGAADEVGEHVRRTAQRGMPLRPLSPLLRQLRCMLCTATGPVRPDCSRKRRTTISAATLSGKRSQSAVVLGAVLVSMLSPAGRSHVRH